MACAVAHLQFAISILQELPQFLDSSLGKHNNINTYVLRKGVERQESSLSEKKGQKRSRKKHVYNRRTL